MDARNLVVHVLVPTLFRFVEMSEKLKVVHVGIDHSCGSLMHERIIVKIYAPHGFVHRTDCSAEHGIVNPVDPYIALLGFHVQDRIERER